MLDQKKNRAIMLLGILIFGIAITLFIKHSFLVPLVIYACILFFTGLYYRKNKYFFCAAIIAFLPLAILIYFQFFRRIFYLIMYGGESANGMGSPLLFIKGFLYELPITILIFYISYNIYKELKLILLNKNQKNS